MARWAVCVGIFWIAGSPARAYGQDRSVSPRTQVVLIARLPDAFGVKSQNAGASFGTTEKGPSSTGIALHAVAHLIPGSEATAACFVHSPIHGTAAAVAQVARLSSERNAPSTFEGELSCDEDFQTLAGSADSIVIETQRRTSADRSLIKRVDVIFSIL